MSAQVYSVTGQTEGRSKAFLEWKNMDLSYELSLTCVGNVNYYKSVHHPVPTREKREHSGNFQNKSVSSAFIWVSRYILFLAKLKGRRRPFLEGARRRITLWNYLQGHLVVIRNKNVSPFVKFEIIQPLLCFLLDPLTNKHCRTLSSKINLWIDSRTYKKWRILLSARQRSNNYLEPSKENVLGEYGVVTLTMFYLKVLHDIASQNS